VVLQVFSGNLMGAKRPYGVIGDVVLGILGSFVGGYILALLGSGTGGLIGTFITAFLGALILIWVVRKIKKL